MIRPADQFSDQMERFYQPNVSTEDYDYINGICKGVTFQVTEDCCCNCSYCYEINKKPNYMTKDVARKCVDQLFSLYSSKPNEFFKEDNVAIILEFIGGEPLMNIDVIDYVCSYFYSKAIELHHPWAINSRISMISNGALYFDDKVQDFIRRFNDKLSFNITIDGPKDMHDSCRVYKDGSGNFDDAYSALQHYVNTYGIYPPTKVTLSKDNFTELNTIVDFFTSIGIKTLFANPVFEYPWSYKDAEIYYRELKKVADKVLKDNEILFSLFSENIGKKIRSTDHRNYCGGNGQMIAFNYKGDISPCTRFFPTCLPTDLEPIILGNCFDGVLTTDKQKKQFDDLKGSNTLTISDSECLNCSVGEGCPWCTANNYLESKSFYKKSKHICPMYKALTLANVYFWNNYYKNNGIKKTLHRNLPNEESLKIISQLELNALDNLEKETRQVILEQD